jgi:hypothetical protein
MKKNEAMKTEEAHEFGQERVLRQQALGIMSIYWLEILLSHVLLSESLLDVVLFKDSILYQV